MRKFLCNVIVRIKNKCLNSDATCSSKPALLSVMDLRLDDVVDCVGRLEFDGGCLSRHEGRHPTKETTYKVDSSIIAAIKRGDLGNQRLHEDLHAAAKTQNDVRSRPSPGSAPPPPCARLQRCLAVEEFLPSSNTALVAEHLWFTTLRLVPQRRVKRERPTPHVGGRLDFESDPLLSLST